VVVRRYDEPYQPTSFSEFGKTVVILGMAVARMVLSKIELVDSKAVKFQSKVIRNSRKPV
jgi:hypothetical protein